MRHHRSSVLIGAIILALGVIGCDEAAMRPVTTLSIQTTDTTPRENYEAEAAALWLSGSLIAPDDLYQDLESGFAAIRSEYADSMPELGTVVFSPPWVPWELIVDLTPAAVAEIRSGVYADLDSLNADFGLTGIDTSLFFHGVPTALFSFSGNYHPERLGEIYAGTESVVSAGPNIQVAHEVNAYPWLIGGGTSYLFRWGWGDCNAGCINNRYWYFRVIGNAVEYVGTYDTSTDPQPPGWWWHGRTAMVFWDTGEVPTGIRD